MFAALIHIPANVGYVAIFALIAIETMGIPVRRGAVYRGPGSHMGGRRRTGRCLAQRLHKLSSRGFERPIMSQHPA